MALDEDGAMLRVNDHTVDLWPDTPYETLSARAWVMKDAPGFAANVAYYDRRLRDDRLDAHWNAGKSRVIRD